MIQINEDNLQIKGSNSYDEEEWNLGDESTNEHLVWSVKDFSSNIAQNTLITRKGKIRDIVNFKKRNIFDSRDQGIYRKYVLLIILI